MTSLPPIGADAWVGPYLRVDGDPFLVVGAEVHNSSSSSPLAITKAFTTVRTLGANTVLAPVAWDQLEPTEGRFDFTLIDAMIQTAHHLGLRLIPLWFGSWKNALSTYAPAWVKTDTARFPRARLSDGRRAEHLSAFSEQARDADARAFSALMRRIRAVDDHGVVIAAQVENEVGLLGDSRDRSALAESDFGRPVPAAVVDVVAANPTMPLHEAWLRAGSPVGGTWSEVFAAGDALDEGFMATALARYVGVVAAAGAEAHPIPLFVNAWLNEHSVLEGPVALAGGKRPGEYPSGGPVLTVAPIWEALAPALDFLAPDAYLNDAEATFAGFAGRRGRLMVPEIRADLRGIAQMFSAVGAHRALGVSPFGVDALDPVEPASAALVDAYRLLAAVAELVRRNPQAPMRGFILEEANASTVLDFDVMTLEIEAGGAWGLADTIYPGYGVAIQDGAGAFVLGRGFSVRLRERAGRHVSFLSVDQYEMLDDKLTKTLRLNGDETGSGTLIPFPPIGARFPVEHVIPIGIPDAGIVRLETYTF